ncbi:MAG TPA: M56 family metallopeptidase [Candidatus Angelobacter sp.]
MELLHGTARTLVEWMFYSLIEGAALALFVALLLRLIPRQNAGTRFALWFSVLLAMIVLPFAGGSARTAMAMSSQKGIAGGSLITIPVSWVIIIFAVWALFAGLALARLVAGLWHIGRLRRASSPIDPAMLGPDIQKLMAGFPRPVSLRLSGAVQVPTAIGFRQPAIVLPHWFVEEISVGELKQVLLHELTHLRRHDDWTNLIQKVVKAMLFFNPPVLWIEHRLSLEREMACDEAVLAQAVGPQEYASCLRHVAEKSFLRRQLALAQSMVNRMRQLSLRVTRILDADRPRSTRLWKPAVPLVIVAASLCGVSAWNAPAIVGFKSDGPTLASAPTSSSFSNYDVHPAQVREAKLILGRNNLHSIGISRAHISAGRPVGSLAKARLSQRLTADEPRRILSNATLGRTMPNQPVRSATTPQRADYVVSEQFFVTMTGSQQNWQVQVWQVRVLLPVNNNPSKTITRKNI